MSRSPLRRPLGNVGLVTRCEQTRAALELLTKAVTVSRDAPLR